MRMTSWLEFASAYLLFLATHRAPTIPSVRQAVVDHVGETSFAIAYSLLSLALFSWLIIAAGRAPYVELWSFELWHAWAPMLAMPVAIGLLVWSFGAPNPLSFGGGASDNFDPERPGPVGFARHGLLWALAIWSAAHIPPNGDLAHVILFGGFAAFSVIGMYVIDRRKQRQLGQKKWRQLAANTSFWPGQSIIERRWAPKPPFRLLNQFTRAVVAALVFAVLLGGHAVIIGVKPWPW
ncbi:MAG: NnrU family protein [Pseudomonadota bacterium]